MTWTREKHVAAILNGMDPRLARAADSLLAAGLIVQVGERLADNGKMLPVYQIIKTAKNKSKWIETLCALPSDVLDAFEESVARDVTTEKDSRKGEAMNENDKRRAHPGHRQVARARRPTQGLAMRRHRRPRRAMPHLRDVRGADRALRAHDVSPGLWDA